MKKYYMMMSLCFLCMAGFSQSEQKVNVEDKLKDPQTQENMAKADSLLVNKKEVTDKNKRKKPKREKNHKECSRMKS